MPGFQQKTKRVTERFADIVLELECIDNLDQTINHVLDSAASEADLEKIVPYFGAVWPSSRAMVEYLLERPETDKAARFLEIGCGLALPSLVLSKLGFDVLATDFHCEVPGFLARNRTLNRLIGPRYLEMDWREAESFRKLGIFDCIIASDVLYDRRQPEPLAKLVGALLSEKGRFVLTDPARTYIEPFVSLMTKAGFVNEISVRQVKDSETVDPRSASGFREIFVIEFRRP